MILFLKAFHIQNAELVPLNFNLWTSKKNWKKTEINSAFRGDSDAISKRYAQGFLNLKTFVFNLCSCSTIQTDDGHSARTIPYWQAPPHRPSLSAAIGSTNSANSKKKRPSVELRKTVELFGLESKLIKIKINSNRNLRENCQSWMQNENFVQCFEQILSSLTAEWRTVECQVEGRLGVYQVAGW